MGEDKYTAVASKPEEVHVCTVLDAGNYPELYSTKVGEILGQISDDSLRERVKTTLGSFESRDGKLIQSSPYKLVVLQPLLSPGKVLASTPRLRVAIQNNPDFIRGFYCDADINLVSDQEYQVNPVQAKSLAEDLRKAGINLKDPKLVPYRILTHKVEEKSPSGLILRLSEEGMDTAKNVILNTDDFKWDYKPNKSGLFRAVVDGLGNAFCGAGDGGVANDHGRVVVESTGEAGSRELETLKRKTLELLQRQSEEREDLISRLSR